MLLAEIAPQGRDLAIFVGDLLFDLCPQIIREAIERQPLFDIRSPDIFHRNSQLPLSPFLIRVLWL